MECVALYENVFIQEPLQVLKGRSVPWWILMFHLRLSDLNSNAANLLIR